jgi:hypothetical protein
MGHVDIRTTQHDLEGQPPAYKRLPREITQEEDYPKKPTDANPVTCTCGLLGPRGRLPCPGIALDFLKSTAFPKEGCIA